MRRRVRGTSWEVETRARELRREETQAEAALWEGLRARRLDGLRFRRQHPLGRFVADFCCPSHRLCVEVDGPIHDHTAERDTERTHALAAYGYRVIRLTNAEVLTDLPTALRRISAAAAAPRELDAALDALLASHE